MKTVVVKRSEWLRGEGMSGSRLYRPSDGKRCCIGFACRQLLAMSDEDISDRHALWRPEAIDGWMAAHSVASAEGWVGDWLEDAYDLNDLRGISDADRERALIALGHEHGIDFQFVD